MRPSSANAARHGRSARCRTAAARRGHVAATAAEAAAGRRAHRIAVQPFGDAAGEGAGLGLRARQPAIELGDARPLVEEGPPVLARPAVARRCAAARSRPPCDATAGRARPAGGAASASSVRSSPSMPIRTPASRAAFRACDGAHSRALQPAFSGADWGGRFASAPSASVRAVGFQRVGADGRAVARPLNRPRRSPTVRKPGDAKPLPELAFGRSADGADDADGCAPPVSGEAGLPVVVMRMIRVRARPSRSKPMSMPILRRKVAARRSRPASARGLSGQVFDLATRSPAISARAPRSSEAVPVHSVRVGHHGAHGGGDRIGVDHAFHRLVAIAAIGRPERARGPERGFAGRRPQARSPPCAAACRAWCAATRPGPSPPHRAARRGCAGVRPRTPPTIPASGRRRSSGIGSSVRNTARSARSGRVTMSSIPFRITGRAASNSTSS